MTSRADALFFGLTATRAGLSVTTCGCTSTSALCECTRKECGVKAVARGRVLRLRVGGLARRAGVVGTHVRMRSRVRALHSFLNVGQRVGLQIVPRSDVPRLRVPLRGTLRLTFGGDPSPSACGHGRLRDHDTLTSTGTGTNLGTSLCMRFKLSRAKGGFTSSCQGPVGRRCTDVNVSLPVLS